MTTIYRDVDEVATVINRPVEAWPGLCCNVVTAMRQAAPAEAVKAAPFIPLDNRAMCQ
jgi:hypothetical protein